MASEHASEIAGLLAEAKDAEEARRRAHERRNEAVAKAAALGAGPRQVAREVGLSLGTAHNLVHQNGKVGSGTR
jgi:DNA-binding NarL/FixJ family response regulator